MGEETLTTKHLMDLHYTLTRQDEASSFGPLIVSRQTLLVLGMRRFKTESFGEGTVVLEMANIHGND